MNGLLPSSLRAPVLLVAESAPEAPRATGGAPAAPATAGGQSFDLPDMGPCRHQPVLLILLFDNSPSVAGGNDKAGQRFAEAAVALEHWRRRCQCRRELVAVRTLDRHTAANVGPVHLDVHGRNELTAALAVPEDIELKSSRLRPALLDAERLAHAHPFHRTELVVFSDFELLDGFPGAVLDRLAKFPGRVHALVLTSRPPPRLLSSPVTVGRITADTPAGAVASTIVTAIR